MSLFKVKTTPITRLGITAYPIVPEFFDTITSYLNSLKKNNLTYWMSIPMLIYGGNHFFNVIDDYLYLYHLYKNNPELICVPFNKKGEYLCIHSLLDYMREYDVKKVLAVPECSDWYNYYNIESLFYVHSNGEGYEFVYDNEEMVNMQGGKWREFRYKVNKFIRYNGEPEILTYTPQLQFECDKIYNRWCKLYQSIHNTSIWDKSLHSVILKLYSDTSYLIKLNDEFIGFVTLTPFVSDTYLQSNRKLLFDEYQYFVQYMQWKQAQMMLEKDICYLNDGDDGNLPGLYEFKRRMHPIFKFRNFSLLRKV